MCADALYAGLDILRPHVARTAGEASRARWSSAAVEGDVHDIGKNLVKMMFEVAGFTVHDLGRDVPLDKFVEEQISHRLGHRGPLGHDDHHHDGHEEGHRDDQGEEPQRHDHAGRRAGDQGRDQTFGATVMPSRPATPCRRPSR